MTAADVNVTERVARAFEAAWDQRAESFDPLVDSADQHLTDCMTDALAALRSPEVVAGIAGVLRGADDEWRRLLADAPQGHPPTRSQWQAQAVVDWLAGGGR